MVSDWTSSGYVQCRKDRLAQSEVIGDLEERIAALEAELAALREFAEVQLDYDETREHHLNSQGSDWLTTWDANIRLVNAAERLSNARQRLAAEHGLPLPGAGEGG